MTHAFSTLDDFMIGIPINPSKIEEKPHIDPEKEYFAVTTDEFVVYSKQDRCWHCLRTKIVIEGNISDVINEKNEIHLHVSGKRITRGKWGRANSLDEILDFYNSGKYLEWLNY